MNKKIVISIGILAIFLSSGLTTAAITVNSQYQEELNPETTPYNNDPLWLRIRNRIRDMLGICDGHCEEDLVELSGTLIANAGYYYINNIEVHFGPLWYTTTTTASYDYDKDGTIELISEELNGLIDSIVIFEGFYQSDNWFSVFTINDIHYRDIGKPIWSNGNGK